MIEASTVAAGTSCLWCGRAFAPRRNGGHPQRFCRPACRRAYDAAGRRWVAEAMAAGVLTTDDLRKGTAATRALTRDAAIPLPAPEQGKRSTCC